MAGFTLTELNYSQDRQGPWSLYIYDESGYHSGGQWFSKNIRYPDEEITVGDAKLRAQEAFVHGREVRVCDGGDMLVYHAKDGVVLYPKSGDFWKEIA